MRFVVDGVTYVLEFQRELQERKKWKRERGSKRGELVTVLSTYPYTTANVLQVTEGVQKKDWLIYRSFTVGCNHRDEYSHETGRKAALKMLSIGNSLSKEFKQAMWDTYFNRYESEAKE